MSGRLRRREPLCRPAVALAETVGPRRPAVERAVRETPRFGVARLAGFTVGTLLDAGGPIGFGGVVVGEILALTGCEGIGRLLNRPMTRRAECTLKLEHCDPFLQAVLDLLHRSIG